MSSSKSQSSAFKKAMQHVVPLRPSNKATVSPRKHFRRASTYPNILEEETNLALQDISQTTVSAITPLFYAKSGLQQRVIRQLKQGHFPIQASLDLHGLTIEQARMQTQNFLVQAHHSGKQHVHIIHGKGLSTPEAPKLKNRLNDWLQQVPYVLAYCSAQIKDGGTGAVYVLLKK